MSKSPRALQELMTAVDARHAVHVNADSASSDSSSKLLGARRRRSTSYGRGCGGAGKSPPAGVAVVEASSTDSSFEFSAVVSYSSASPASMVFSDGQIRAHQFPAVRSSASTPPGSSQARSPVRGSTVVVAKQQQAGVTESNKRVSFATDGADKAGGGHGKKSGGLLGCCGLSSGNQAVEPVARNDNRKVVAV